MKFDYSFTSVPCAGCHTNGTHLKGLYGCNRARTSGSLMCPEHAQYSGNEIGSIWRGPKIDKNLKSMIPEWVETVSDIILFS